MVYEIIKVAMEDEFKICPSCGYKDGFHSMLKNEEGHTKWLFICVITSYSIHYTKLYEPQRNSNPSLSH